MQCLTQIQTVGHFVNNDSEFRPNGIGHFRRNHCHCAVDRMAGAKRSDNEIQGVRQLSPEPLQPQSLAPGQVHDRQPHAHDPGNNQIQFHGKRLEHKETDEDHKRQAAHNRQHAGDGDGQPCMRYHLIKPRKYLRDHLYAGFLRFTPQLTQDFRRAFAPREHP